MTSVKLPGLSLKVPQQVASTSARRVSCLLGKGLKLLRHILTAWAIAFIRARTRVVLHYGPSYHLLAMSPEPCRRGFLHTLGHEAQTLRFRGNSKAECTTGFNGLGFGDDLGYTVRVRAQGPNRQVAPATEEESATQERPQIPSLRCPLPSERSMMVVG